jgi:hypothetical protein
VGRNVVPPISTYPKAERRELYRKLSRIVTGDEGPPPPATFEEMRERLHLFQQSYGGIEPIPVAKIVGSAARTTDFDEDFLPTKPHLKQRWESLERAYPTGDFPPIVVYRVNDVYFVIDGHHRVGIAKQLGVEYIDAEITRVHTDADIHDALAFHDLVHMEMRRYFMRASGLGAVHPEAAIQCSEPEGYPELLEHVRVHGYHMMTERGEVLPREQIAADWYERTYLPTVAVIREEGLTELTPRESTETDLFLWVHQKRRSMFDARGPVSYEEAVKVTADKETARREAKTLTGRLRAVAERRFGRRS